MRYTFIVFILFWTWSVSAQLNNTYTFRHIDQTDGLLHTTVEGIVQDERGFIWLLTWNGLQRYDGTRFVNYPEITNRSSFSEINASNLYMDTVQQQIWIMEGKRLEQLNLNNNIMSTLQLEEVLKNNSHDTASSFTDENQNEWLIGEYGVIVHEKNTSNVINSFFNFNPFQSHRNTYVIKDPLSGDFWLHKHDHFLIADAKSKTIYSSSDQHPEHPLLSQLWKMYGHTNKIRFLMLDSFRNLWISTWSEILLRYNLDTKILITYSLKDIKKKQSENEKGDITPLINAIYEDRQKNLWLATDYAGLLLYEREKDDFNFITSDDKIANGLRYNFSIYTIFQDRHDNIWLGTDRGISIFNPYRNHFQSIRHEDGNDASLPKNEINDIIETQQGEIFVASWGGGISVYDQQWHFIRNIYFDGPEDYNLVWSFVRHDDGTIWVGSQHGYIHMYDPAGRVFKTINPKELGYSTVIKMVKDPKGNIFLGLNNGKIVLWKKEENIFYPYADADDTKAYASTAVIDLCIDHLGQCWVTTAVGLQQFDIGKRMYTHLYQPESIDPSTGIAFQGIQELNDSTLLLGAIYGGLYFFNTRAKTFSRPLVNDATYNTSVYAIRKDSDGTIWLTTNYSIVKMNTDLTQLTRFNIDHSVMNAAFGSSRFYELNDGRWVATTPAELVCFDPEKIGIDFDKILQVEICGFKVFDQPVFIDSFLKCHQPIILPFTKNFISIEFSALNFTDLRQTNYYYRLSGIDKNWIHSTTKQFADYTDLHPGEYLFEVKADYGSGPSTITSFAILITPPWWGTLWFRTLCILAVGSLIYFVLKNRIHTIRKEAALKHRIAETEMMALRAQMNPHFIFNCINSIDAMIQRNDKYRATVYLNKFAKLIRNVLDSSNQNKIPLSKDIETLQLYVDLELFRHQDKFTASILADDELMQNDYKVPPLIVQPYVENAILHGLRHKMDHPGILSVTVTRQDEYILYVIEDNGVGRKYVKSDSKKDSNGYGMQISSDRVRLFNKEEIASVQITDLETNGVPAGTRVEVQLKIQ